MDRIYPNPDVALEDVFAGAVIAFVGFFSAGKPLELTRALAS